MYDSTLQFDSDLSAVINRANGSIETRGTIDTSTMSIKDALRKVKKSLNFWDRLYVETKERLPLIIGGTALAYSFYHGNLETTQLALVTTAGINLLAADFVSGASTHIASFIYADCGTGTTSAAIGDTGLQAPSGAARVAGTQSTPVAGTYRNVATISFTSTLAITEYGLFSAASTGTMWDHRVFSPLNVNSGDSITFSYSCVATAGGS